MKAQPINLKNVFTQIHKGMKIAHGLEFSQNHICDLAVPFDGTRLICRKKSFTELWTGT